MGWLNQYSDWVVGWMVKEFEIWQHYELVLKVPSLRRRPSRLWRLFHQRYNRLVHEADHTLPSHATVKSEWSHTSISTYAFVLYTGTSLSLLYTGPYWKCLKWKCKSWGCMYVVTNNIFVRWTILHPTDDIWFADQVRWWFLWQTWTEFT